MYEITKTENAQDIIINNQIYKINFVLLTGTYKEALKIIEETKDYEKAFFEILKNLFENELKNNMISLEELKHLDQTTIEKISINLLNGAYSIEVYYNSNEINIYKKFFDAINNNFKNQMNEISDIIISPVKEIISSIDISDIMKKIVNMSSITNNLYEAVGKIGINAIEKAVEYVNPMEKILKEFGSMLNPISQQIKKSLPKMTDYFKDIYKALEEAETNPNSLYNWINYANKLNDFFWTLPYKIESKELKEILEQVNSEEEFDNYIEKHFTKELIEELFLDIDSKLPRKYKKIFKQIKNSYIRKDYSLASVGLTSMIDGLCSYFIYDKGITNRRDLFIPIIEEVEQYTDNNFETVPLIMLNNNINTIYEKVNFGVKIDKKISTTKKIRRHPFQHGQFYCNEKDGVIMLLNTLINLLDTTIDFKIYKDKLLYVRKAKELNCVNNYGSKEINKFYIKRKYSRIK